MKIIYTSALIPNKFDVRKTHYQESYNSLLDYFKKDDIYVVECFSDDVSFFNELCASVYITNTHDINIRNKGVLELSGIKKFIDTTKQEDEVFLKLTGRYKLLDNSFIKTIEENKGYDFYGRLVDNKTQVFTGCFAIKDSILREFLEFVDLDYLERNMINIEKALLDFLNSRNKKCFYVDKINIFAPIFGDGNIDTHIL